MRDRKLTGPWAGFSFKGGRLVTPEGHELEPGDLAWLSLTAVIAREWRVMMDEHDAGIPLRRQAGNVVHFRDGVRGRYQRKRVCMVDGSGPGPGLRVAVDKALKG